MGIQQKRPGIAKSFSISLFRRFWNSIVNPISGQDNIFN